MCETAIGYGVDQKTLLVRGRATEKVKKVVYRTRLSISHNTHHDDTITPDTHIHTHKHIPLIHAHIYAYIPRTYTYSSVHTYTLSHTHSCCGYVATIATDLIRPSDLHNNNTTTIVVVFTLFVIKQRRRRQRDGNRLPR